MHPRRFMSSATQLRELQLLYILFYTIHHLIMNKSVPVYVAKAYQKPC